MIAIALGLVAALSWGTADFAARFSGRAMGPPLTLLIVTTTGAIVLGLWLLITNGGFPTALSLPAFLYGLFAIAGTLALYEGLNRAPICTVAPLASAFPAWSLAYLVLFDGLRPAAGQWAAMALVMAGVIVVSRFAPVGDDQTRQGGWSGLVLALAAGAFFGGTLVSGLHASQIHGQAQALWLARMVGVIMMIPALWTLRRHRLAAPRWLALAAGQGGLDTLAFVAILSADGTEDAAIASVVASSFGIVTILWARLVLHEKTSAPQGLGIAATFIGIAILSALG